MHGNKKSISKAKNPFTYNAI